MKEQKHVRFDWAIKRLLKQRTNFVILEGFLSELTGEDIKIIEIIDAEGLQENQEDKYNRVDVLVKNSKDELIIIEVQNSYAIDYFLRILYGISKAITEFLNKGSAYGEIKKVISVNIVYFELGQGSDYIYRGTTTYRGIHDDKLLHLTAAQKRYFKKKQVQDIYPEIYLIKVNTFDDIAKNTLDEWIYFLKNSEIKKEFSAKGIKEADETLKVANMSEEERKEYNRFVEVLSDRASIAETIEFEAELRAKKLVEKAEKEKEKANKEKEETIDKAIEAMVLNTNLSDENIATTFGVKTERVRAIRGRMK